MGSFFLAGVLALRVWLHGERTVMHWSILENEITYMPTRKQRALATAHVRQPFHPHIIHR
jgi:hypothetical protein